MKKFLISSLIFILVIVLFIPYSFASKNVDCKGFTIKLPDAVKEYKYLAVIYGVSRSDDTFYMVSFTASDEPIKLYKHKYSSTNIQYYLCANSGIYGGQSSIDKTKSWLTNGVDLSSSSINTISSGYPQNGGNLGYSTFSNDFTVISNHTIYDYSDGSLVTDATFSDFRNPYFLHNGEDFQKMNMEYLQIVGGSLVEGDVLQLNMRKAVINNGETDYSQNIKTLSLVCMEGGFCQYLEGTKEYFWKIPKNKLGWLFENGDKYLFSLECSKYNFVSTVEFTIAGRTDAEVQKDKDDIQNGKIDDTKDAIDRQTSKIEEQTEVNKNIFERLGELLDFLNPFSENFFVYKLLELLGDLLKSLFVPSEDFLSKWFTDISDYFEDAFGILYYPVDLVIQILGRFADISGQEPVISFGDLSLFGTVLIPAFSYNFNDILQNDTLSMIHNFYLITIDVILWFGLLIYCKNVLANIFGGKFTDDVIDEIQDPRWK